MANRPHLLFLSALFPLPVSSGTQLRVFSLLQRLSQRFDITFLSLVPAQPAAEHLEPLQPFCTRVVTVVPDNKRSPVHRLFFKLLFWLRRITRGECADRFYTTMPRVERAIRQELRRQRVDVLLLSYWFWSAWILEAPGYRVIDANDVQAEREAAALHRSRHPLDRLLRPWLLRRYAQWEAAALRRADCVVATTTRDRRVFQDLTGPGPQHLVVPTGVDAEHFTPRPERADPENLMFYGALQNPMNVDAVRYLCAHIMPRVWERLPAVRLTLVGTSPHADMQRLAAREGRVSLTGYVEDVRQPLWQAGAVVLPLRYGHGIRGRVFELLSMGIPVVATSVAVAGMELHDGDGLLLADTATDLADAVGRVLQDAALRRELGRRGRELALSRFSLAATYDPLVTFLAERCRATQRAAG